MALTKIRVYDQNRRYEENTPTNLFDYREWLDNKIELIPEEFRGNAEIVLNAHSGMLALQIYYYRPETNDEYIKRIKNEDR